MIRVTFRICRKIFWFRVFTCDGEDGGDCNQDEDAEVEIPADGLLDEQRARVQVHLHPQKPAKSRRIKSNME